MHACICGREIPKIIWIVRDPIVSVCSYIHNLGMEAQEAFEYWFQVNCMLWYLYVMSDPTQRFLVKFEHLVLNPPEVESTFEFVEIEFSPQFIRYGDFDHNYPQVTNITAGYPQLEQVDSYPKAPEMQELWRQYRNEPMIRWLGYNRITMD